MKEKQDKIGRKRRYTLEPPAGFANRELAHSVAQLQELAERVYDQIVDLAGEALDFTARDTPLSISMLVLHMAWAEARWVQRLTGVEIPDPLRREIEKGSLSNIGGAPPGGAPPGEPPPSGYAASKLIELCRQVQRDYAQPALSDIKDMDTVVTKDGQTFSVRGVIGQLAWHWIYHSGQIGLLRLIWGSDYQWRSEDIVTLPPR
ncbi:MAG: DinB family protein [Spirochaetaceae bacterium]|nr:MAG: DinB family protein [Spirochaetaceae bacterium]